MDIWWELGGQEPCWKIPNEPSKGRTMTDNKIKLKIATPAGFYEGTFADTDTVEEVIARVVKEEHLVEGDHFDLALDGKTLPRDSKLWELGLKDGADLDLVAGGSAV